MTTNNLALGYVKALQGGNLKEILDLFTTDGQVISPLYGKLKAAEFYLRLLKDTNQSKLTLKEVFDQKNGEKIAIYFNYQWTLQDGSEVSFDVVDILELDGCKIEKLTIIYDTFNTRSAFQNLIN